jgi:hypothetical protein
MNNGMKHCYLKVLLYDYEVYYWRVIRLSDKYLLFQDIRSNTFVIFMYAKKYPDTCFSLSECYSVPLYEKGDLQIFCLLSSLQLW